MSERIEEIREWKAIYPSKDAGVIVCLKLRDTPFIALEPEEREWLLTRLEDAREVMEEIEKAASNYPRQSAHITRIIVAARRWLKGEGDG